MPALSTREVERLIRQTAVQLGAADLADVLVATATAENGLSNTNPGDRGPDGRYHSFGPFHENDRGRGAGLSREQMEDVVAATGRAVKEFRAIQKQNPGADPGTLAYLSQRPRADLQASYIKRVNGLVGDMRVNGDPDRNGVGTQAANQARAGAQPGAGRGSSAYVFPVVGYKEKAVPTHWGSNAPGARGAADLFAPEGTPVRVMAGGKVTRSYYDQGGGNSVEIAGDDGNTYYYAHLRDPSALKAGQVVKAGAPLGFVGTTGNARTNGAPPHLHLGIGKGIIAGFGPDGGAGRNFDATTLLNQTLKGGAGYVTAGTGGRTVAEGTRLDPSSPEYQAQKQARIDSEITRDTQLADYKARVERAEKELFKDTVPRDEAKAWLDQFAAAHPELGGKAPSKIRIKPGQEGKGALPPWAPGGTQFEPGGRKYVDSQIEANPDYAEWKKNADTWDKYTKETPGLKNPDKERVDANWKLVQDERRVRDSRIEELSNKAASDFEADQNKAAAAHEGKLDTESGIVYDPVTGEEIARLPRDVKPGTTFNVPGKGTFLLHPDGSVTLIEGTQTRGTTRTVDTTDPDGTPVTVLIDENGDIIQRFPRTPGPNERNRVRTIETYDEDGNPITALVDDDQGGKIIAKYPRQAKDEQVTAPRDAQYIVRRNPKSGELLVEKNPNWDPNTGSISGINTAGRVYRVLPDGKTQLSDTLTPEERAVYNRGEAAKATGAEATAASGLIDAATKIHEAEMKDREAQIWAQVQKVMADPNATGDQIWGVIQAGAKDAKEWTDLLRAHVEQRTQEEVGRHNRVGESIDVQNADRLLREGLYKDINETRNQRTLAQQASNQAQSRGIIGAANSANVLSGLAPLVGSEGIKGIGTIGLGVGEEVTRPVQQSWEAHQKELEDLRNQMPSVRMANPNLQGPSFQMPRGTPTGITIPPPAQSDTTKNLIDKANQLLGNAGKGIGASSAGQAGQGIGAAAGAAAQTATAGAQPQIVADDLGTGMAQQFQVSPTGERTPWGEPYKITPDEEPEGGGGYSGPPRFQVPGRERAKGRTN